jgi:hypothetical protein
MEHLIENKVDPKNIIYFSFDEVSYDLKEIIESYEAEIVHKEIRNACKIYIFLDEIQKLKNWQNQIKIFYDLYPNIKFIISGSSSLFIRKKSVETLTGRLFEFKLFPLNFKEFLEFKYKELYDGFQKEKNFVLYNKEMNIKLKEYFYKNFPEVLNYELNFVKEYLKEIANKISYDILEIFRIEDIELLKKLINIIISKPGMILNYNDLASELNTNRIILSRYINYLEESFLIKKIYNFSKNVLTSEKRLKRVYPSSASFGFAYTKPDDSLIVENIIVIFSKAKFFWRDKEKHEVDIVLNAKKILPIEVKYKNNIAKKDLKNIIKFMDRYKCREGIIITKNTREERKIGKKKIELIPAWLYLVSGIK